MRFPAPRWSGDSWDSTTLILPGRRRIFGLGTAASGRSCGVGERGYGISFLGFSKYIIGSMAVPVRWLMRMGGLPADKQGRDR